MDAALETIKRCNYKRVGILGGTFNPIHREHIAMCYAAMKEFSLDSVILMPSGQPPHKINQGIASKEDRFAMVSLAVENCPSLLVSKLEVDRENTTFTIETIQELKAKCPEVMWYYIIGSDTLLTLDSWKDYQEILKQCFFIVFARENQNIEHDRRFVEKKYSLFIDCFLFSSIYPKAISSTQIRRLIAQQISVEAWVQEKVIGYIAEHQLYMHAAVTFEEAEARLKNTLSKERFLHTIGVVKTAEKLARTHHQDIQRARWGGLLHDCAKEVPIQEVLELQRQGVIDINEEWFDYAPQLIHAKLGVYWAKKYYDMWDEAVLDSILNHTTGSINMTELDKIIFLADMIEPNRQGGTIQSVRDLAFNNLDDAMLLALDQGIQHLIKKEEFIHLDTIKTRNAFWKKQQTRKEEEI